MAEIITMPASICAGIETTFRLRSLSLSSQQLTTQTRSVYGPLSQIWVAQIPYTMRDRRDWLRFVAAVDSLDGIGGLVRMGDPKRPTCWRNLQALGTTTSWSDGTDWSDGSSWADGVVPGVASVGEAAARGATSILIAGLPALLAPALVAGDLFEIRPNGTPAQHGHLYQCRQDAPTDQDGMTRVSIRPRLRADVAAGDQIVIDHPTSVFQLVDDDQGLLTHLGAGRATSGLSLIEKPF